MRAVKPVRRRKTGIRPARRGAFARRRRLNLDGSPYRSSVFRRAVSSLELKTGLAAALCGLCEIQFSTLQRLIASPLPIFVVCAAIMGVLFSFIFRLMLYGFAPASNCVIDCTAINGERRDRTAKMVEDQYLLMAIMQSAFLLAALGWGSAALLFRAPLQICGAAVFSGLLLINAVWYWRAGIKIMMGDWTVSRRRYARHPGGRHKSIRGFPLPLAGWRAR